MSVFFVHTGICICLAKYAWRSAYVCMCISLHCSGLFQVSCLGAEACVEGDPCRLALTSRAADGSVLRFVLQAATPETSQAWVSNVGQILETQRNFLNGKHPG